MALQFGTIDPEIDTVFPATMEVDWIRVYQHKDSINVGCDPKDYPTMSYIETQVSLFFRCKLTDAEFWVTSRYKEAYTNPNFTTWKEYGQPWPKNRLAAGGC